MHLTGASQAGFPHSTALHTCNSTGDADHQPGRHDAAAFIGLANEGFDHLLSGVEVGDHAVTQGPHGANVAGGTAQHHLGLIAHGQGHTPLQIHGHHRGLLEHDAFARHEDEGVGGAQINADIARKLETTEKHGRPACKGRIIRGCYRRL